MIDVISEIYDHRYSCDLERSHQITTAGNGFIPNICEVTSINLTIVRRILQYSQFLSVMPSKNFSHPVSNSTFQIFCGGNRTFLISPSLSKRLNTYAIATFELKKIRHKNKRHSIFYKHVRTKKNI